MIHKGELLVKDNSGLLQLSHIEINEDYRKKWNIHGNDFKFLTKNGELVRDTIYRVGGMNDDKITERDYSLILKYTESLYPDNITTDKNEKRHLKSSWVIINKFGEEKVVFEKSTHSPYLVKDSVIYSLNSNYYNIETGEFYCRTNNKIESDDYLFLENHYDSDETKRGVLKINKKDGSYELFK